MKPEITPERWEFQGPPELSTRRVVAETDGGIEIVAHVYRREDGQGIAALPELRALAERIANGSKWEVCDNFREAAKSALTKARGETV